MVRLLHYQTSSEAYLDLYLKMLGMDPTFLEKGIAGHNFRQWTRDLIIEIDQPRPLPINLVGFSIGRWTKFLTEYFSPKQFQSFLIFLKERKLIDAGEYAYICSNHARHNLGNCLFGLSINTGHNPRVSLISRSCNLIPTGILDLSIGSLMCRYVADIMKTEECRLVWQISHLQINSWPSLLFLLNLGINPEGFLLKEIPFQENMMQVFRWSKSDYLPSIKYQFYARYMKKINRADLRRKEQELVFPIIPAIPHHMLPVSGINQLIPQEILHNIPNPYNPIGAQITTEERLDGINRTKSRLIKSL